MSETDDVERLKAERDELERKVEQLEDRPEKRRRTARVFATIFLVLAILLFAVSVPATWARRTLLDTDRYVATVAPLANDPAVQEYLARTVTEQLFVALQVQQKLAETLQQRNSQLAFLAGPIANAVEGFVQEQLQKVFATPEFAAAWTQANQFAHAQLLAALRGGGDTVTIVQGKVILNLLPLVNQGIQAMSGVVSDIIGHPVTLPAITGDEIPAAAIQKLESALGVTLPPDLGQIVVYNSDSLAAVQKGVDLASRLIIPIAIAFLVCAALALWISPRKRRTLLQLATALIVVLVIERRFAIAEGNSIVGKIQPENQAAGRAVVDQVIGALLRYTGWMLAIAIIVLLVAAISGPYPWAVRTRRFTADVVAAAVGAVRAHEPGGTVTWVTEHRDALMLGGAVVGALLLLVTDLSLAGFLILLVVLAVFEVVVYRAGSRPAPQT